jgi:signal transduction histidine kinase
MLGEWQEEGQGYRVELRLPRGLVPTRLGVQALDFNDPARAPRRAGMQEATETALLPLIHPSPDLQQILSQLVPDGMRARLLHAEGWVLAEAGSFPPLRAEATPSWWRRLLYRGLSHDSVNQSASESGITQSQSDEVWQALSDKPAQAWRSLDDGRRLLLATAVPVRVDSQVRGALLLERPSEVLLLTQEALSGLMFATLLVMLVVGLSLFLFAGRLGQRIRRLSRAADAAIAHEGRSSAIDFPLAQAGDELGDLSRSFSRLLGEVSAYTDYLRSLAGKLSHELHTPIAVVRSSLENLETQSLSSDAAIYVGRAREGVDRLAAIVRAMSESSRVERAIAGAEAEDVDLRGLIQGCADGYRPLLAPRRVDLLLPPQALTFHGAPDLIVQALDKLVDNARGFCPESGWILLALAATEDGAEIAVANSGPALPEVMRERLFDSLVSMRDSSQRGDGSPHLGLGLHIVRLIAQLHEGSVRAANLPDGNGVEFRMRLRALPRRRSGVTASNVDRQRQ